MVYKKAKNSLDSSKKKKRELQGPSGIFFQNMYCLFWTTLYSFLEAMTV
jgi:hypothetical protein